MQSLPTTPDPRTFRWMTNHSYRFNQDTENVDCRRDVGEPELLFNIITDYFITMNISITGTQYWESYAVIVLEHLTSNPNGVPKPTGDIAQNETLLPDVMLGSKKQFQGRENFDVDPSPILKPNWEISKYIMMAFCVTRVSFIPWQAKWKRNQGQ
ncbi:hypothetical protein BDBG_08831 [Blastomyces gilchristii SLH14081]|uniref:Uncharacterized protein n=1 Tax=Blastomyces gilchristii (strain SLH14081) TaxID=559298 RepID=A0A179V047_BLAGS|nr:uncharacterized protein BDBG_08831 [Blastomyces gilchristii SLH14081]OAT13675.1 hypothetical protein BDBG_08831 [Blastomyces gilchristii SLH14081]